MGYAAAANATSLPVTEGNVGVGYGATVGKFLGASQAMKGGVGSICLTAAAGFQVGALVVVNALGNVVDWEQGGLLAGARSPLTNAVSDFTNAIMPEPAPQTDLGANTTLGVIVTDVETRYSAPGKAGVRRPGRLGAGRASGPHVSRWRYVLCRHHGAKAASQGPSAVSPGRRHSSC